MEHPRSGLPAARGSGKPTMRLRSPFGYGSRVLFTSCRGVVRLSLNGRFRRITKAGQTVVGPALCLADNPVRVVAAPLDEVVHVDVASGAAQTLAQAEAGREPVHSVVDAAWPIQSSFSVCSSVRYSIIGSN